MEFKMMCTQLQLTTYSNQKILRTHNFPPRKPHTIHK